MFPEGLLFVSFDQLLHIVALAIATSGIFARHGSEWVAYIHFAFVLTLVIVSLICRRRTRTFLKEHGPLEISITLSPGGIKTRKNIFYRDVGEIVDEVIDRVLDGKEQDNP